MHSKHYQHQEGNSECRLIGRLNKPDDPELLPNNSVPISPIMLHWPVPANGLTLAKINSGAATTGERIHKRSQQALWRDQPWLD